MKTYVYFGREFYMTSGGRASMLYDEETGKRADWGTIESFMEKDEYGVEVMIIPATKAQKQLMKDILDSWRK